MTSIAAGGGGGWANVRGLGLDATQMFERLGMPGALGASLGEQIDDAVGDIPGMFNNILDMFEKGLQEDLGKIFGGLLPSANAVPSPMDFMRDGFARSLGGFSALGGVSRSAPFGEGGVGRSIEAACRRDPHFKSVLENALGGVIIPDGRNDGRLSVYRPPEHHVGHALQDALGKGLLAATGLAASIANVGLPFGMGGPLHSAVARLAGNLADFAVNGPQANQGAGNASASAAGGAGGGGSGSWEQSLGPEASEFAKGMGIDLSNASFEDVLFLLLMKYAKKKEDDIMKKVKELDKSMQKEGGAEGSKEGGGAGSGGGAGGAGSGGGVGGAGCGGPAGCIGNVASGCVSGCTGGSGGAIGGALGQIMGGMGGAGGPGGMLGGGGASGASGGGGGGGEGGGMSGGNLGEKMDASKMSDTMKQQMLQKLMGDLQKLYEMLSNMIKSMHDMQMTPTRNLRG